MHARVVSRLNPPKTFSFILNYGYSCGMHSQINRGLSIMGFFLDRFDI